MSAFTGRADKRQNIIFSVLYVTLSFSNKNSLKIIELKASIQKAKTLNTFCNNF